MSILINIAIFWLPIGFLFAILHQVVYNVDNNKTFNIGNVFTIIFFTIYMPIPLIAVYGFLKKHKPNCLFVRFFTFLNKPFTFKIKLKQH